MIIGRRLGACCAALAVAATAPSPLAAQSALDIFGTHWGGSRRPVVANQWWITFSALLLTQFDGRLQTDSVAPYPTSTSPPPFIRHDDLWTTVGYNYFTLGGNLVVSRAAENHIPFLPRHSAFTLALSGHFGATKDTLLLAQGQRELHDFRGVTRNYHGGVSDGRKLAGFDVEALLWPETTWLAFGAHLSMSTYHQEQGLTVVAVDGQGSAKFYLQCSMGLVTDLGVGPSLVAAATDDFYLSVRASAEHTDRYGLGITYSTGIFPDESELLVSLHTAIQFGPGYWFRIEHVNDILGGKDRGPTGGARVTLARTF